MIGLIKMQRRQKRLVKKHPSTIPVHLSLVTQVSDLEYFDEK